LFLANVTRGHKVNEDKMQIESFVEWISSLPQTGYIGRPYLFSKEFERYAGKY